MVIGQDTQNLAQRLIEEDNKIIIIQIFNVVFIASGLVNLLDFFNDVVSIWLLIEVVEWFVQVVRRRLDAVVFVEGCNPVRVTDFLQISRVTHSYVFQKLSQFIVQFRQVVDPPDSHYLLPG